MYAVIIIVCLRDSEIILVPPEQVAGVDAVGDVGELVAPAVGDDEVAAGLEGGEVVRDLAPEELRGGKRRLVDEDGHALGLHALHDALHAGGAEVVAAALHGEAVDAHRGRGDAGVHEVESSPENLAGNVVLAGTIGLHNGGDRRLRHITIVHNRPFGVLRQAIATVTKVPVAFPIVLFAHH